MLVNSGNTSFGSFTVRLLTLAVPTLLIITASCSKDNQNRPQSTTPAISVNVTETTKNPLTDRIVAVAAGKPLYASNCASCHGAKGKGDSDFGASLPAKPSNLTINDVVSDPDGKIFLVIKNGKMKNGKVTMPPVKGMTDEQIWQIVAYVRTLAGDKKED